MMMKKILILLILFLTNVTFSQEKDVSQEKIVFNEAIEYKAIKESLIANKKFQARANSLDQRVINPDGTAGGINIKGNITFVANNIVNRDRGNQYDPEYPYDGYTQNGSFNMQYIDVDNDNTTFSSSSDELNLPACSRVVYAGLYWSSVYPYESWSNRDLNDRRNDYNTMKFRLPGGSYQNITADSSSPTNTREVLVDDGYTYIFNKDITALVQGLSTTANPDGHNGTYVAANIIATTGQGGNGSSAGWTMVIVYENETESSKNIAVFDGYAEIDGSNNVDLTYSGFTTVPVGPNPANPAPVRASVLAAALEGDRGIGGDRFQIQDNTVPTGIYRDQFTTNLNPTNNFFNGSISRYDSFVTTRTPDSENSLGFDVDLYELNNPNNSVITNGQTSANVRFTTTGDVYYPFLNALAVEIIQPEVQLLKTINDTGGVEISGTPVGLGAELFYNITFQNVGTDDASNTIITDRLPKNVDLLEVAAPNGSVAPDGTRFNIDLPAGVTIVAYDPPAVGNGFRAELQFSVPDDMVLEGGDLHEIDIRVQVVSDCNDLRDVCSNEIQNQAFASYEGIRGGITINDEPSFAGLDNCDFGIVGTSNFLVDTSGCTYERTEVICGANLDIVAGSGFASYSWVEENDPGVVLGTNQTLTVTQAGTYIVSKIAPVGCIDTTERVIVVSFNDEPNPLAPFASQVLPACNGFELAEVYLCGINSSIDINLPFTGSTTVNWYKLDDVATCTVQAVAGCANIDTDCDWTNIGTELDKNFDTEGEYRLEVLYDGRCPQTYYFNVYKATLNPTIVTEDIVCNTAGTITINNVPNGYEYSLTGPGGFNAPFSTNNTFSVTDAGDYDLAIRLVGAPAGSCTYTQEDINIQSPLIQLNVTQGVLNCADDDIQITASISGVPGEYSYEITRNGVPEASSGGFIANDSQTYSFSQGGTFVVSVESVDGCIATETLVINKPPPITLSATTTKNISCVDGSSDGIITLTPGGGTLSAGLTYAISVISINGVAVTPIVVTGTTYDVALGDEGVYIFEVVDSNNCSTTATATVIVEPEVQFTTNTTDISCNGLTDGQIAISINGADLGYTFEYSIDAGANWNATGVFSNLVANPSYTVRVRASKTGYQCIYDIENIEIQEPAALTGGSTAHTNHSCDTNGNTIQGTITFTDPTGGTGAYTFYYKLAADATYTAATSNPVINLGAGTYNIRVEDANGCPRDLADVIIDPIPGAPTFNQTIVYNCEGEGTITITPFDASYTYTLDGGTPQTGANANVFADVAVGAHSVRVNYFGNCRENIPVTVRAGNEFSGSIVASSDSECFGSDNGTITIGANNPIGGSFEYSTDGGSTWSFTADNPYRVVGLAADTYNVFIREVDGGKTCIIDLGNVVITQPDELTLTAAVDQQPTCTGPPSGTIIASASGGVPPYEFSIDDGATWQSSNIFNNVPGRITDYIVMIRDSRNCNECGCTSNLFENGSFEQPTRAATTFNQHNEDDVPGWDTTDPSNTIEIWYNNFQGVPAKEGVAFAELNSRNPGSLFQEYCTQPGDEINWSVSHRGRAGVDVATVKIGDDLATASIVATMTDGNSAWGDYSGTYIVPVGQSTTVIAFDALSTATGSLSVGNFIDDVNITIARNNCVPVNVSIQEPDTVEFTVTPETCYNGNNGTLTVDVTGGNDNYLFSKDNGVTWETPNPATPNQYVFSNLAEGTYNVTVQDGLGCTIPPIAATINAPIDATVATTNANCNDLGEIAITPSGGDGNYQYVITPIAPAGAVITSTTSPINVPVAGTYTVSVRDQNGAAGYCEYTEDITITRIADPTIVATPTQPDCSGGTGSVSIAISNGTADYTTTITLQGAPGTVQTSGPSSDVSVSFSALANGTYDILTTDANGCTDTAQITIAAPNALSGDSRESQIYTCAQLGEISVENVTGGTAPYTYTLSDGTNTTTFTTDTVTFDYTFEDLTDGTYTVIITDVNTCSFTVTPNITIAPLPTAPVLTSAVAYNCDGTGTITISPFDASYTYTLNTGTPIVQSGANANIFTNVPAGNYTVTVDYGSDCEIDATNIDVLDNQEFTALVTDQTNPVCIGDTNGAIEVTASFPSTLPADFDYSLDGGTSWSPAATNPFTIPNLADGTHNIRVRPTGSTTDCNITLAPVTLSDPSVINVAATVTKDIDCNTDANLDGATITITPTTSGGNGGAYTYELFDNAAGTGAAVQTGAPFTDIDTAGDYWVVAIDAESCRSTPFQVNVPDAILVTFTVTPEVCYNSTSNNGTLTVNILTGNGNYSYSLDGGTTTQTSNIFTDLTDGTYDVTVTDDFECTATVTGTVINPQIDATVATTNANCNDLGEIAITPSGGDGNYQYVITPIAPAGAVITSTTSPINVPVAGTYTVSVSDQNGAVGFCEYTEDITITRIADPTIVATPTQPDCSGGTGSVSIAISNGTADYTTTITLQGAPGTVQTSGPSSDVSVSFSALANGTYDILTTDANGCTDTAQITIAAPNALSGDSRESQIYTCTQLGEISVENVTGGTAPYTYTLSDGTNTTTFTTDTVTFDYTFEDLTDGTYTVTITDVNTCSFTVTPDITIAPLPTVPALTSAVAYNCDGTGNITITPAPAGTYSYTLGAITNTSGVFNNLSDGTYTVTVDYGSNCTVDVVNITVLDNQEFTALVTDQTNPVCIGDTNGAIEVTASFPSTLPADFDYSLDGGGTWIASGANPFTIPNLADGTHNIRIRPTGSTTDCNITLSPVTLSDPSVINVAATVTKQITCDADPTLDGATITITPTTSGGNGGAYTYELFDNAAGTGAAVQTGAPFTDIDTAGDYWVVAIDAESCRSTPVLVNVPVNQAVVFTATPQCYDGANGIIDLNVTSGNGTYEYSLDGTNFTPFAPANATTFNITGLSNIAYTVTVRDIAGCTDTENATINDALVATATPTNASCTDGQILVTPTGGSTTGYEFSVVPDGNAVGTYAPANPITGLTAGTYDVYVRDDAGCDYTIQDVVIEQITPVAITATPNQPVCNGNLGSIDGVIADGQAPFEITIANTGGIIVASTKTGFTGTNFSFNDLPAEAYTVTITDALGCSNDQTVTLADPTPILMNIEAVLPNDCLTIAPLNTGFDFNFKAFTLADYSPYTLQYTIDVSDTGTNPWTDITAAMQSVSVAPHPTPGDNLYSVRGLTPGVTYRPSIRILNTDGTTRCQLDNGIFVMPFQVKGIVVDITTGGDCVTGYSVTVEADGGTGPFEFGISTDDPINTNIWYPADDPIGAPRVKVFTDIIPGLNYVFYVRDLNGCVQTNDTDIPIVFPDSNFDVNITPSAENQSCNGASNGALSFLIDDLDNVLVGEDLTWELFNGVTDSALGITGNIANTVTYPYTLNSVGTPVAALQSLPSGLYYVVIEVNAGAPTSCKWASGDIEIQEGQPITGNLNPVNDITCSVEGTVRIENVVGGFGGYTYVVTNITNTTLTAPITITGTTFNVAYADVLDVTAPVNITIEATDVNGCLAILTPNPVVLNVSPSPTITSAIPSSCGVTKTITVTAANGTPPYTYSIDGGANFTAPTNDVTYTGTVLTSGTYDVVVNDANGCSVTQVGVVIQPDLEYEVNLTKNLTCDPVPGDEATYEIDNVTGSGAYTYEIIRNDSGANTVVEGGVGVALPATPFTFSTAIADVYTITITDTAETPNCTNTKTFTVAPAVVPVFTTSVTNATCDGTPNGSIGVSVTAGLTPLTYSIAPAAGTWVPASNSFTGVPAGTYTVRVTGANGCFSEQIETVNDNPVLTVTAPVAVQFGCTTANDVNNATLSIDVSNGSGGTGTYTTVELYHDVNGDNPADNLSNTADDVQINTVTVSLPTYEFLISDVTGGSYYVRIVDSANCEAVSASTDIAPFDPITDIDINSVKDIDCTTGENISVKTSTNIDGVIYDITNSPAAYVGPTSETVAVGTNAALTFTNLPTGSYTITATHPVTGCVFTKTYTVGTAPDFTVIANNPQATCFGDNGGSIDVSFDASTTYGGVYDYEVLDTSGSSLAIPITGTGISGATTQTITGLLAGTYYVEITMTNTPFCTESTNQFTITQPTAAISVTGNVDPGVSCTGVADATITATGAAGFGGYTYQLEVTGTPNVAVGTYDFATNGSNNVFTGLAAGSYTIRVRDVNDCEGTSVAVVVADPIAVSFTAVDTDNACDTNVDGSILVTAAGGTGSYTYVLTNSGGTEIANTGVIATTTHTFSNLTADDYTVSVTDSNGCTAPAGGAITISEDLIFTLDETKNLTCDATPAAAVVIEVASGSGSYTYEVTGPGATVIIASGTAFTSPLTFNPTVVGTYTVIITDTTSTPNCSVTRTIDIAEGLLPVFTTAVTDATCNGGANGSIAVAVTAGLTPLTYSIVKTDLPVLGGGLATWDAASNSFINVPAGTYTVTVEGDNGCSTDEPGIVVADNPALTVTAPVAVQFGCTTANDVNNATLSIRAEDTFGVSGGTTIYSSVKLYNDNGTPVNLADDIEITTVTVTGTTYEFSITDVTGGSYYVEVVDSASCMTLSASTDIAPFDPITDIDINSVKDIDCATGDNIEVKTSTDIDGVTYDITNSPAAYAGPTSETVAAGTDPALTFIDLPTGLYTITATHPVTGCVFTKTYTVGIAPDFTVIANNPQATCFGDNGGNIDISFDASTTYGDVYNYEVFNQDTTTTGITSGGVPVNGGTTQTITGLSAGTYYVVITMVNTPFCTEQTNEFTITQPTAAISVTGVVDPGVSCTGVADATITATGADGFGGYTYQLEDTATNAVIGTYDFVTNGSNNMFTGLAAGDYTIRVRDVNDCEGTSAAVVVADPIAVSFTAVDTDNACDTNVDGSILVTAAGGTGSYTYVLTNSGGTEIANTGVIATTTHTFSNLTADDYTVSVTDSNGCTAPAGGAITISEDLIFTLNETKNLTCDATPAAEVVIEVASGSGSYTYEITGPSATVASGTAFTSPLTFNPTVVGTYTVIITDTASTPNCSVTRTIDIEAATLPSFTASVITDNICNGASNGAIRVTAIDNGISPLTYTISPSVGTFDATTNTFEDLPADTYTITTTGANGCTFDVIETVNENPIIDISGAVTVTDFDCAVGTNTTNNATISVDTTGAGGTSNFVRAVFVYDNGTPADTSDDITQDSGVFNFTITNEAGGEVTVTVFDDINCSDSATRTIAPFARITAVTITPDRAIDCNEGEDILTTYTSTLPITNVEYRLYNDTSNALLETRTVDGDFVTLLPTGVYRIEVENTDTNCVFTEFYTVNDAPVFDLIIDNIQRACFNGTASVDVSFNPTSTYIGNYTYEVFNVGGVTTGITGAGVGTTATTITGLAAGNYYVTISMIDTPFCSPQSNPFEIVQPTVDLALSSALTYIKCTPTDSGEVSLTAAGGWGVYEYELVRDPLGANIPVQNFSNNSVITGLTAGDYTATVRDANNCTESIDFRLNDGVVITGTWSVTPNVCIDETTATISVDAIGGQLQAGTPLLSYTYILEYPDGTRTASQSSNTFTNLPAGDDYYVLVADGYSCDGRVGPIDIVDPTEVEASANITAVITCDPLRSEAVVEVSGTGGTGPYEFSTDGITFVPANAAPNHTFNLPAGEHQVYVRDNESCISDAITVRVNPYTDVTATLDVSSAFITCNGNANAVLIADAQDGFGNYEYQLVDENDVEIRTWQTSNSFTGLDVGIYKINVRSTNAAGDVCSAVTGEYEITQPLALTGTAVATQHVTCFGGNTGIITAQGFDGNGGYEYNLTSVPVNPLYPADKFVTNGVFENLPAATYYVTIKDVVGCTIIPAIEVIITEPQELQISLVNVTQQQCLNDPTPTITVDVQGGLQPYYISVNEVEIATPYNQNQITLGDGDGILIDKIYVISVRDSGAGCGSKSLAAIPITAPVDLQLTVDFEYTCPEGNIIKAIVADKYKNDMSYTLYDGAGAIVATNTTGEFIDVAAGNGYYVSARHAGSTCSENSMSDRIDIQTYQALTMTIDDSQKNKLIADVNFGLPPYNFTVDGVDYGEENEFLILQTKVYTITVRDARGCEVTLTVNGVYVSITILNLFTPDGDGINDYWYPLDVEPYHNIRVLIFDRYARKITNYQGFVQGWDGTYDGKPLPAGDYWYTIYYNELSGEEKKLMGHFTLYR